MAPPGLAAASQQVVSRVNQVDGRSIRLSSDTKGKTLANISGDGATNGMHLLHGLKRIYAPAG